MKETAAKDNIGALKQKLSLLEKRYLPRGLEGFSRLRDVSVEFHGNINKCDVL